jgi:hypothetical protein
MSTSEFERLYAIPNGLQIDRVVSDNRYCNMETEHAYRAWTAGRRSADNEFKNFHRLLCYRFGYSHDEKDWKRDQLSLVEWIAVRQSAGADETTLRVLPSHAIRRHGGVTIFGDPSQVLKVMAAIESAGATGQEPVAWEYRALGSRQWIATTKDVHDDYKARNVTECRELYAAPIGDNVANGAIQQLADKQRPLDPEFAKVLNENLEDLYSGAQPAESKRAELTDDEILDVFVQTKGATQKEYMVNVARALLARASAKGE